jgi:hypothetical protein
MFLMRKVMESSISFHELEKIFLKQREDMKKFKDKSQTTHMSSFILTRKNQKNIIKYFFSSLKI